MNIAIIGHSPEYLPENIQGRIESVVNELIKQYGSRGEITFLLNGEIGVSLQACRLVFDLGLPYKLFLARMPDELSLYWYKEQADDLELLYKHASGIYVNTTGVELTSEAIIKSDKQLIEDSNAVVCFWANKKIGRTYTNIKYAISIDKLVYNALDNMKLISKSDL